MAKIDRFYTNVYPDRVEVVSPGSPTMAYPRQIWDQVIADYNNRRVGAEKTLRDFQQRLIDIETPGNPWYKHPQLPKSAVEYQIRQAQNYLATHPVVDPANVRGDLNVSMTANLVSPKYLNMEDYYFGNQDALVHSMRAKEKSSGIGSIMRTVVPAAISLGAGALGGFAAGALTPGLSGTLGGAMVKGAASGAVRGALSGEGLKGVLKGAATGTVSGGLGHTIAGATGLSNLTSQTIAQGVVGGVSSRLIEPPPAAESSRDQAQGSRRTSGDAPPNISTLTNSRSINPQGTSPETAPSPIATVGAAAPAQQQNNNQNNNINTLSRGLIQSGQQGQGSMRAGLLSQARGRYNFSA